MTEITQFLISKDNGKLQLPYDQYVLLMEKMEDAKQVMKVKAEVLAMLQQKMGSSPSLDQVTAMPTPAAAKQPETKKIQEKASAESKKADASEKVSIEFSADESKAANPPRGSAKQAAAAGRSSANMEIPPIKKEIAEHFNAQDASGRLFNVFKQYYTCLNESCGGTVRVTMKDGVCSLWNYDEWEEFAFVDIYESELRFAVDPRYTNDLASLNFCEVPRLLASRRSLVCIQSGDLNKTMLDVLAKAFHEVGLAAS